MEMNHLRVCRPPNTHMHAHDTHPHRTGSQYVHAAHITDRRCPSSTCAYYLSVFFSFFFFFSPFIAPPVSFFNLCLLPFPFLFFSPFNCSASDLLQLVPTTFPPPFSSFSFSPLSRHGNELFFFQLEMNCLFHFSLLLPPIFFSPLPPPFFFRCSASLKTWM